MEILYLIGNGLDIAQGLNTRYTDFYKKYSKPYDTDIAPAAKKLRSEIDKDYSTWADMESSFGKYTKDIPVNDLEDAYYDLADSLRDHLTEEQGRYKVNNQFSELAKNDLIRPYATLLERDKEEILDFITRKYKQNSPDFRININIISFNYTNVLEQLLSPFKNKLIGTIGNYNTFLQTICHVHGTLEETMIMGVNDSSQLYNEEYKTRNDLCNILIKPQSNNAIRSNNDIVSKRLIQKADIIIVFGMSLGETDRLWWQEVGAQVAENNAKLILFEHLDKPLDLRRGHKIGIMREEAIRKFTSHLSVDKAQLRKIENNTYVNFNTDFLSNSKGVID